MQQSEIDYDVVQPADLPPWEPPSFPARKPCLRCGKPAVGMFCDRQCRQRWLDSMARWSARVARTRLVGAERSLLR